MWALYRRWLSEWPLAVVLAFALWFTSPLWMTTDRVFAGRLSTDNVVTPWFYDFVARSWRHQLPLDLLTDFDWPVAQDRMTEFPDVADAMLAAPLAWWLGWPAQWGATLSLAVVINGLGMAVLARAVGCKWLGVLTAGAMGVMMRPVWTDMVMGRLNVAFPGVVALAVAMTLLTIPRGALGPRIVLAAAAAGLGALSALIYPPFLVLLAPLALLALAPLWRSGFRGTVLPLLAIVAALLLVSEELRAIYDSQASRQIYCGEEHCPDLYNTVSLTSIFRAEVEPRQGLSLSGLTWPSWWLVPLVLLHRRRWVGVVFALVVGFLVLMSLGPCPRWSSAEALPYDWVSRIRPWLQEAWCVAAPLHDYGRFASAAAVILALLSGIGVDGLWRWSRPLAVVAAGATLWACGALVLGEVLDYEKWHEVSPPVTAQFLMEAEPGPVAELPFDRSKQFLSVLYAPGSPRVNPLQPSSHPNGPPEPVFVWLFDLGWGRETQHTPSLADIQASGLRWVFFDPARCPREGCSGNVVSALRSVLGVPSRLADDVYVWDVQSPSGTGILEQ